MRYILLTLAVVCFSLCHAQPMGRITGTVVDKNTHEKLCKAVITLTGKQTCSYTTDSLGRFDAQMPVGTYRLQASYLGYESKMLFDVSLTSGSTQVFFIELEEQSVQIGEVIVKKSLTARATDMVTPLATQRLTSEEIKVSPGGNFDLSKVIQVLPGVAGGTTPNRNDIIVRGGGPSENVYYLDGIEIPILNHFQTQGASGGATGVINVSFVQDMQLTSSAFDARYDNALASTIVIKQRNGNPQRLSGNFRLSGSEAALMAEGPVGKQTTFMASARRSYLQFLFKLLDLPIRPDYYDFQVKVNHIFDGKNELNFIGLGTIDHFQLSTSKKADANTVYLNRANPLIKQWSYTMGASFKHVFNRGYLTVALSRNSFFNGADRYEDNAVKKGDKLFSLSSHETENKLRMDVSHFVHGWKYGYGFSMQHVEYDADIFSVLKLETIPSGQTITSTNATMRNNSLIRFFKFGTYAQIAKYFMQDKFLLSAGMRTDINTFTDKGKNPLRTVSPRISVKYRINELWDVSASVGSYYKLPVYTMLGYKDRDGGYANRSLDYTRALHYTVGVQLMPRNDFRFTFEGFYKAYSHYPLSVETGVSFANVGTDYEAVGGERYISTGRGRVYGVEAYVQKKLMKKLFYVASATLYKSEFSNSDGKFAPSTWDYGFVVAATMGYKFGQNWELGAKYRVAGGQPYTPFDMVASQANYLRLGTGVYDYTLLNTKRMRAFHQLDVRIDKKFNFMKSALALYLDIQNVLLYKTPYLPRFTFERNEENTAFLTTDGRPVAADGSNAIPKILTTNFSTIVPSLGFIFEF